MLKIDITKAYQTRQGTKVRLISDQGSYAYPIVGLRGEETGPTCWTADGYYYNNKRACEDDLIPVPQTIKTIPYRRFIAKTGQGYYTDIVVQCLSDSGQLQYIEAHKSFMQWVDADWITESFEITQ